MAEIFTAFRFELKALTKDGDEFLGGFSNISGLDVTIEVEKYQEGGSNEVYSFPKGVSYSNLVLKKGLADEKLWNWYKKTLDAVIFRKPIPFRDLVLTVYTVDFSEKKEFVFTRAFPVKWSGSELNATGNSIFVETLEIAHRGISRYGR